MSYCRFSSDKYRSDVYVYESADGFTIHVASKRYTETYPGPDPYSREEIAKPAEEWRDNYHAFHHWLDNTPMETIGLPHDGETIVCDLPGICADTLQEMRDLGYNIPDGVIEELRAEQQLLEGS